MKRIRVAAAGAGWVALHRHFPAMKRCGLFEIAGVIDRSPGHAREVAMQHGCQNFAETDRLAEVPWIKDIEAITVGTAPMSHYSMIRQALELGKHVLTEKPFAMTVAEGEALAELAASANLRLAIVHNFQFARSTRRLLREIESGRLGKVCSVSAVQFGNPGRRLPKWYEKLPLGLFYDESPHLLYLVRKVAGPIELCRCIVHESSTGLRTPARIDAYFRSSALAGPITLTCNFESPVSEWYLMVFGEQRLGIVDVFRDIYLSLPNDGLHETRTVIRTSLWATAQHFWQHAVSGIPHLTGQLLYGNEEVFTRFARAIRGFPEELEPIGPENALAVLRLQHAIVEQQETINQQKIAGAQQ